MTVNNNQQQSNTNAGVVTALQQIGQRLSSIQTGLTALATPLGVFKTGVWTPTLQFGGASTGITYSTQLGTYSSLANIVVCSFQITLTAVGSATGAATLSGLPVASLGGQIAAMGIVPIYSGMSGAGTGINLSVAAGSSSMGFFTNGATASAALTNSNFGSASSLSGLLVFFS